MTTAYTREQLADLARQMAAHAPPILTQDDLVAAKTVARLRVGCTELGAFIKLKPRGEKSVLLFLNAVLIVELLFCIDEASGAHQWDVLQQRATMLPVLADPWRVTPYAFQAISLRLGSDTNGAILAVTDGKTMFRFYLSVELITALFGTLGAANQKVGWWDDDMVLVPNDGSKVQ